jgi:hypothetical protein
MKAGAEMTNALQFVTNRFSMGSKGKDFLPEFSVEASRTDGA